MKFLEYFSYKKENIHVDICIEENTRCDKILKVIAVACWLLLICAQSILIFVFSGEQLSDSAVYCELARNAAENHVWYPSYLNLNDWYIFGNGLVNLLALIFRITDNVKVMFILNMIFTQLLFWSCRYIIKKSSFNKNAHLWFTILFCLLNTFWSEVVAVRTEIVFTSIAFCALGLLYTEKKYNYVIAGILLAIANWVRPLGIVFIFCIVFIFIYKNQKIRYALMSIFSYIATIILIGTISLYSCGSFVYQSSTLGVNLLMSANDEADGGYISIIEKDRVGYIDSEKSITFEERDDYYKQLSIEWISENPYKYIAQIPNKLFFMYSTETYSGSAYFNNETNTGGIDYIKSFWSRLRGVENEHIGIADVLVVFNQAWYMLIFVLFVVGIIRMFIKNNWRFMFPYFVIFLLGTGVSVLTVGAARYHFPYLPIFMMYGAFLIQDITNGIVYNDKNLCIK